MLVSIAPVGTAPLDTVGKADAHAHHGGRRVAMDAAAQSLGMTRQELRTALSGGQTIASIATTKGISTATVKSSMAAALLKANPNMSPDRADQIAQRFLDGPKSSSGKPKSGDVDHDGDSH
jgi:hypothetical protein